MRTGEDKADADAIARHAALRNCREVIAAGFDQNITEHQALMLHRGITGREQAMLKVPSIDDVKGLQRLEAGIGMPEVRRGTGKGPRAIPDRLGVRVEPESSSRDF
ncbi:hypothetical protein [Cupriavidus oxalaticus]|uniref:hypothetical protein n=1 Tax=Cupriavidus oxalaticus TaxID=96344 RepID=UPI00317A35DE